MRTLEFCFVNFLIVVVLFAMFVGIDVLFKILKNRKHLKNRISFEPDIDLNSKIQQINSLTESLKSYTVKVDFMKDVLKQYLRDISKQEKQNKKD